LLAVAFGSPPVVKVGGKSATINFLRGEVMYFDIDASSVPESELGVVELVLDSQSTCYLELFGAGRIYPIGYVSLPGPVIISNWFEAPLSNNVTNLFYANSTIGSCLNTMVSAMLPPSFQLPRKSRASISFVRAAPESYLNVSVGSAGQMV